MSEKGLSLNSFIKLIEHGQCNHHYYITENKRNGKLKTISILITWGKHSDNL